MSKFIALIAGSIFLVGTASFAADATKDSDSASKSDSSAPAAASGVSVDKGLKGPKGPKHDHPMSKRAVLALPSLTDKQKDQINAIYNGNQAQFDSLQKQLKDIRDGEWAKIKPILTAEQLDKLHSEARQGHHHGKAHAGGGAAAAGAAGTQTPAQPGPDADK